MREPSTSRRNIALRNARRRARIAEGKMINAAIEAALSVNQRRWSAEAQWGHLEAERAKMEAFVGSAGGWVFSYPQDKAH